MDLFNTQKKKNAVKLFEESRNRYDYVNKEINERILSLYSARKEATELIDVIESVFKSNANIPSDYIFKIAEEKAGIRLFIESVKIENVSMSNDSSAKSAAIAAAGTATGMAVATLGAPAAMAFVTTFGTAATGTAISALSGAAATNAALAFLGGGAIAAGGGGMAAGAAVLGAIPVIGWTIGGVAAIGGSILVARKNNKITASIDEQRQTIDKAVAHLADASEKIRACISKINSEQRKITLSLSNLQMSTEIIATLNYIMLHTHSLCLLINKKITLSVE